MGLSRQAKLITLACGTTCLFLAEIIVGYLAGSLALVADSFHMLSDIVSMVVAWYAIRLAARTTRTPRFTYGLQRAEILGALVNGVFLLALCFTIVVEAIQRYFNPEDIDNPKLVLIVGCLGLAINLVGLVLFRGHAHGHSDMNMHGVFLHVLGDALGSIGVIVSAIINIYTEASWRHYIDPSVSLLISFLIIRSTVPLVRNAMGVLMMSVPGGVSMDVLRKEVLKVDGVEGVHEFHVWSLNEGKSVASVHLVVREPGCGGCTGTASRPYMDIASDVKKRLHAYGIHSTTIQPEFVKPPLPNGMDSPAVSSVRSSAPQDMDASESTPFMVDSCLLKCNERSCESMKCCVDEPVGTGAREVELVDVVVSEPRP
ncbi:cation efflux family-domain-containing protein [Gaertneriomyces semiglobifer]|nr:cation efflux family-domain-containing protein [Gaertneriomyces semiglobifer]